MSDKYNIGDKVWYANFGRVAKQITCTDCNGDKYLTVIKGDGTQVTELTEEGIEYGTTYRSCCKEDQLSDTREESDKKADELGKVYWENENKRMMKAKHKQYHTWAWNATYHKREIKRLEKDLAYHRAKLDVATRKSK